MHYGLDENSETGAQKFVASRKAMKASEKRRATQIVRFKRTDGEMEIFPLDARANDGDERRGIPAGYGRASELFGRLSGRERENNDHRAHNKARKRAQ